jgi:hypothetical protein
MDIKLTDTIEIGGVKYVLHIDAEVVWLTSQEGFLLRGLTNIPFKGWEQVKTKIEGLMAKQKRLQEYLNNE